MKRRTFLQGTVASGALAVAAGAGLLKPGTVMAASDWAKASFEARGMADATKAAFGGANASESGDISIKAPLQAENGAVVPIKIETSLPDVSSISVFVAENPTPLATIVGLSNGAAGYYSTRVKMGKTSDVVAYVKSGDKLMMAKAMVKVTVGGCGG
jgi:sulfur-oxidizing protein SoxY